MNPHPLVAPTDLRDYARERGWALQQKLLEDRIYVLANPKFARRELVFPMDTTAPDYLEAVELVVGKLADLERTTTSAIFSRLLEIRDDSLSFRVMTSQPDEWALPLRFASAMVEGAEQLLLASACTVLKPQAHHPRLSRVEAQSVLEAAKFRHTRPGSFVLNVSCPVLALDTPAPLLLNEDIGAPFVRRTTIVLQQAIRQLVTAIEKDAVGDLINAAKTTGHPVVSSNLCGALLHFNDASLKNSVEIGVEWAGAIPRPQNEPPRSVVRIQQDYFPRIEEVRQSLRADNQKIPDVFIATVEQLEGEMGADGRRAGDVILRLLTQEDVVRARARLTADQYKLADEAHMNDGVYVKVGAVLHPGRQPRLLDDIKQFDLIRR